MFLKQYNYKPRQTSGAADTADQAKAAVINANGSATTAAQAGRRRSSVDQKFGGLQGHKRTSIDDKRASYAEQGAQTGVLGQMWSNFTKGK
ncbi:hypothetical protein LTR66_016303 [Elasticomyces elasticus]|nr:hypothetical protein LTR66_016303 [Elasticomyces elasticus]